MKILIFLAVLILLNMVSMYVPYGGLITSLIYAYALWNLVNK